MTRAVVVRRRLVYRRRYSVVGVFVLFLALPFVALWWVLLGLTFVPGIVAVLVGAGGQVVASGDAPTWADRCRAWGERWLIMVGARGRRTTSTALRRPAPPAPPCDDRLSSELVRLATLRQAGVLTDAEFEQAKARTLGG